MVFECFAQNECFLLFTLGFHIEHKKIFFVKNKKKMFPLLLSSPTVLLSAVVVFIPGERPIVSRLVLPEWFSSHNTSAHTSGHNDTQNTNHPKPPHEPANEIHQGRTRAEKPAPHDRHTPTPIDGYAGMFIEARRVRVAHAAHQQAQSLDMKIVVNSLLAKSLPLIKSCWRRAISSRSHGTQS